MGMQVYYYDIEEQNVNKKFSRVHSVNDFFREIDILSIHLPYNIDTHNFIDATCLSNMKKTAFIVNTARGGVIDEKDLLLALKANEIAGYATDVLYGEPDIFDHPLVKYAATNENVIITPHIAGNTYESIEKTEAFVLSKLIKEIEN
jgi:D-3-phosphoglycerate dehydrogenase